VMVGVAVALIAQTLILAGTGRDWHHSLDVSVSSVVVGFSTAKVWFLVMHHEPLHRFITAGAYIQGFLVGTFAKVMLLLTVTGLPVGPFLDASTPRVFFAMAIARPGCFPGGCCVGRPTTARWGLWSSDRRVGVRRMPAQLIEAAMALTIGMAARGVEVRTPRPVAGALFVAAMALDTAGRQLLFSLREEPRQTAQGRRLNLALTAVSLLPAVLASATQA
jgi:phosphatidylglycerol:prolipoprotein diacylglycerol transferase